jgi:glycosyltransferase involved in cell wall biosynthesis
MISEAKVPEQVFLCNTTYLLVDDYNHMVQHFANLGQQVTICTPETPNSEQREQLGDRLLHRTMPLDRTTRGLFKLLPLLRDGWRLGRQQPHAIFTLITAPAHILYGIPLRLLGCRLVFLMAGMGTLFSSQQRKHRLLRPLIKALYRWLYGGKNSKVITQNNLDRRYVVQMLGARDATWMPGCGANPEAFMKTDLPGQNARKIILIPARIIVEKGVFEAVEASRILDQRGIAHELWFSNDIDPGNPISLTQADKDHLLQTAPSIRFIGFQEKMGPVFQQCDLVCLPSYREGLPTALIEASACGRPIVATNVEGCNEIVIHEQNGLLVPARDAEALANALERVLTDVALAERLAQAAYQRFLDQFTREQSLRAVLPVYSGFL